MAILILLWGLLAERGIWCLTGPHMVTVRSGSPVTVQCMYDAGYENYIKYWCRGQSFRYCIEQIRTTTNNKEISTERFTIMDTPATRSFNVTMADTGPEDTDIYYCAIERNLGDNNLEVKVKVLPGICHVTAPWTDIVHFPSNFTGIEADHVVEVACQERYMRKNISLQCRKKSREFVLSPQGDGDYCVGTGICSKAAPWTHIVDFPENFTEIAVNGSVVVSCQQRYGKRIRLQCREESRGFVLSPQGDGDYCVDRGVCSKAAPWTHIVDFPENFTEIAVNGSVVVSCQRRYGKKIRLRCREESGEFLLYPENGQDLCGYNRTTALTEPGSSLLTSTIGFVVPFLMKLAALLIMLVMKFSCMINKRFRIHRQELDLRTSLEKRSIELQQKARRKPGQDDVSAKRAEVKEIYENLEDDPYENFQPKDKKLKIYE